MNRYLSLAVLLGAALLSACGESAVQDITGPMPSARIKFLNFGVGAPGVNFYANDTKMTAISSTDTVEHTNGVNYGGAGAGAFYTAIAPGQYTFSSRISAAIDKNLAISNATATIADGKSYTFYVSGIYNTTTKQADAFVVEDPYPPQMDYAVAYVRFVNAISNSQPMTLHAMTTDTSRTDKDLAVGGEVAYKSAGAFVALPPGVYDLGARVAGSSTNAISRAAVSFAAKRVYTITSRGDITVATGTAAPFLDNTANR